LDLNCVSDVSLFAWTILILVESLGEDEIFLPLELFLVPVVVVDENLEENKEMKGDIEKENWCPPNAILLLEVDEHFHHEEVDTNDGIKNELDV